MVAIGPGTTFATPLQYPATSRIERAPSGNLYALVRASTADTFEIWRSTNGGGSWALLLSLVRANVQEVGSLIVYEPYGFWCYRTLEGGQDRIYFRMFNVNTATWLPETLVASPATGMHTGGLDMQVIGNAAGTYCAIGVGTVVGGSIGLTMYGVYNSGTFIAVAPWVISGTRQWLAPGSGRIGPSLDIEHIGDPHTAPAAHLWATWGRTDVYVVRCAWTGAGWSGPTSAAKLNPITLSAQDAITGRWTGDRFVAVAPDPVSTSTVAVFERDRSNSGTRVRQTPAHPAGVVRNCSASYNTVNGDIRVYAVGTATTVLWYADYVRATNTWTAWATVTATALLGATGLNYSPRRSTAGNARFDVLTAHAGAPNTIVHTAQSTSYPPNTPTWDTAAMGKPSGAAADVAVDLVLDWTFSDPDPADTQSAWALSRQIGAGTIQYWRNSDSTWQPAEVKNVVGATTAKTLLGWNGGAAEAAHTYKVKVWDSADIASAYSDGFVVVPSAKANPTITSPAAAGVITTDTVTPTWTVTEQTAYRLTLASNPGGVLAYDSGWVTSSTLTATIPTRLADLTGWTVSLQTRNLEGLASNVVSVAFSVDYLEPAVPTLVATPVPASGVISVTITNPAPGGGQPALANQDLHRRQVGDTSEGIRIAAGLGGGAVYADWGPASGIAYEYRVLARGVNGTSIFGPWTA